ncbi:MAG: hypothetical protein JW751_10960 [Polyangiaceae bacterium]|nr:hypothetical protein [Polyangiaceae bacterium]
MTRATRYVSCLSLWLSAGFVAAAGHAEPAPAADQVRQDPAAAREQLKVGYQLKKEGKFAEALPHLLESLRLHSQIKTLMNIADCQEHLLQFADAQKNWVLARDQAVLQGQLEAKQEAEARLAALEARMPRLVVILEEGVPVGTEVYRDGVLLGEVSLGAALPLDPGQHRVTARAPNHGERIFDVTLAERDQVRITVAPGPLLAPADTASVAPGPGAVSSAAPPGAAPVESSISSSSTTAERKPFWGPQRAVAAGMAGLGVVALVVAPVEWSVADRRNKEAILHCDPWCEEDARDERDAAERALLLSRISLAAGVALGAGAAVLWFTAPRNREAPKGDTAGPRLGAVFGPGWLGVTGRF